MKNRILLSLSLVLSVFFVGLVTASAQATAQEADSKAVAGGGVLVKGWTGKIDPKEAKGNTLFRPHVTIAYRDIPPEVFPAMWEEFKNRKFNRSFKVESFSLLKHDGKQWNLFREFHLKHSGVQTLF